MSHSTDAADILARIEAVTEQPAEQVEAMREATFANLGPEVDSVTFVDEQTGESHSIERPDADEPQVPEQRQVIRYDPVIGPVDDATDQPLVIQRQEEQQAAADALLAEAERNPEYQDGTLNWHNYQNRQALAEQLERERVEAERREAEERAAREAAIKAEALVKMEVMREFIASKLSIPDAKRDHYLDILSLWMLSTYSYQASGLTAYLYITAKKRGSGKSQVGKLAYVLTPNPTKLLNPQVATPAVLADFFEEGAVTLFDESDKLTAGEAKEMSALLNLGNVKGGARYRMRAGKDGGRREQSLFAPKVVMGIARDGSLPFPEDTISRGITLEMEECSQAERQRIGRFGSNFLDYRDDDEIVTLRDWMRQWSLIHYQQIRDMVPELPELTGFRRGEVVEPIVGLADILGGDWPARVRAAIVALDADTPAPVDPTDAFLANVAAVVSDYQQAHPGVEFISSADFFDAFKSLSTERLTPIGLGKRLAGYKVTSSVKKVAGKVTRGYYLEDLAKLAE